MQSNHIKAMKKYYSSKVWTKQGENIYWLDHLLFIYLFIHPPISAKMTLGGTQQ